ncbi:MAG: isoprenylcysteine carboxylmethyltransferase family protein [bacterium]
MGVRQKSVDFIYNIATGRRCVRAILTPLGGIFFFLGVTLFVIAALKIDRVFRFSKLLPDSTAVIVSLPVLGLGVFLILWSNIHFLKARGTPVPFNPPPKLVTAGPYAYARNPMLTGVFILLSGIGLWFGSVSMIFFFIPLFIIAMTLELKFIEEPELEKRLGVEYAEYKKRVPMFIPRFLCRHMYNVE